MCAIFTFLSVASSVHAADTACTTDLNCSLNGVCSDGSCLCDAPWAGRQCGLLRFAKASPAAGRDLYPINDTAHNSWNGPMIGPIDGTYHMYLPLYPAGLLYHPTAMLHGTAPDRFGPWTWTNLTGVEVSFNPGALVYGEGARVKDMALRLFPPTVCAALL